jgi:Zn-dependent alcohol dehydrogenase
VKTAIIHSVEVPMIIEDVPVPKTGHREVLLGTRNRRVYGAALPILEEHGYFSPLPHTFAHEQARVITEIGNEVSGFH